MIQTLKHLLLQSRRSRAFPTLSRQSYRSRRGKFSIQVTEYEHARTVANEAIAEAVDHYLDEVFARQGEQP